MVEGIATFTVGGTPIVGLAVVGTEAAVMSATRTGLAEVFVSMVEKLLRMLVAGRTGTGMTVIINRIKLRCVLEHCP